MQLELLFKKVSKVKKASTAYQKVKHLITEGYEVVWNQHTAEITVKKENRILFNKIFENRQ